MSNPRRIPRFGNPEEMVIVKVSDDEALDNRNKWS